MGLGSVLKNNAMKIGDVTGNAFPMNSVLLMRPVKSGPDMKGDPNDALCIAGLDGDILTFTHQDVQYACICVAGIVAENAQGIKYRVELKDGKAAILTVGFGRAKYVERILF